MVRRWWASAVVAGASLVVFSGAARASGADVGITCPETARRNQQITATARFENWSAETVTVTRGALGLHLGNVTLVGPLAFQVNATVPGGALGTPPCTGCFAPFNPGVSAPVPVSVRIPAQARPGTFVTVGLGFFGTQGADPTRREIGSDACIIEITP